MKELRGAEKILEVKHHLPTQKPNSLPKSAESLLSEVPFIAYHK